MTAISKASQLPEWKFSTITNHEGRIGNRKRVRDTGYEEQKQRPRHARTRVSNKKQKTVSHRENAPDASNILHEPQVPHDVFAGDWRFEPSCADDGPSRRRLEEDVTPVESVDVNEVICILLQALNEQGMNHQLKSETKIRNANEHELFANSHRRPVTSPLSGSPDRIPLVRKAVGGSCRGKVDAGLQRWVLCKNHYDDIRSCHPSLRSEEWIEALHEMGWENLHPTYMSQSQQTFRTLTAFSRSCDEWIDIENTEEQYGRKGLNEVPKDGAIQDQDLEGIHEDVWDLGLRIPSRIAVTA